MHFFESSEEAEKPADLSQRIVFKVKKKEKSDSTLDIKSNENATKNEEKTKTKKGKPEKNLLSFGEDEEDE